MATWPSASKASTTNLDSGTDSPAAARADIKQNVDNVNSIIDMFNIVTPSNNQILKYNTSNSRFELAADTDTGITDLVQDTTPQLGGALDVNGNAIVSASNGNIAITPNGTGKVILDGLSWPTADGSANQVLKTDGAGNLSFATPSAGGNNIIMISTNDSNGRFTLANANDTAATSTFTLLNNGGVSGVSVSSGTFTLPSGTYYLNAGGAVRSSYNNPERRCNFKLQNTTDGTVVQNWENFGAILFGGSNTYFWNTINAYFTISGTKTFEFRTTSVPSGGTATSPVLVYGNESPGEKFVFFITKVA